MEFLVAAGLQAYGSRLLCSGFDDLDALAAIEDIDMVDLGIPKHHACLLRRKLQDLRLSEEPEPDEGHPVVAFLRQAGLDKYARLLLAGGFDDMETLMLIDDQELRELDIPRGHALKLQKRLREYQSELSMWDVPSADDGPDLVGFPPVPHVQAEHTNGELDTAFAGLDVSKKGVSSLQQSWTEAEALGACVVAEVLLRHTFELGPDIAALFPVDVRSRYHDWTAGDFEEEDDDLARSAGLRRIFAKIVNVVGSSVAGARNDTRLVPLLIRLGARHFHYGVRQNHMSILGQALDLTLEEVLGAGYTPEVRHAWCTVFRFVSSIMAEGARQMVATPEQHIGRGQSGMTPPEVAKMTDVPSDNSEVASTRSGGVAAEAE